MINSLTLDDLYLPIRSDLKITIDGLYALLETDNNFLNQVVKYVISTGGKHLRPSLSLLCSRLFTESLCSNHYKIAQIVEIIHLATLLHDDVIDESSLRRNKETVNALFGGKVSVIAGDFLLARASMALASLKNIEIIELFASVLNEICLGEMLQSSLLFDSEISLDSYLLKSSRKTAVLFAAAMEGSSIVCNAKPEQRNQLKDYGMNFGLAFQIIDDILNFSEEREVGKPSFEDLRSGIITAPVIFAIKDYPELKQLIETKFTEEKDLLKAVDIIKSSSALIKSKQLSETFLSQAKESLLKYESTQPKQSLLDLLHFVSNRKY